MTDSPRCPPCGTRARGAAMKRYPRLLIAGAAMWALAWFMPVVAGEATLAEGRIQRRDHERHGNFLARRVLVDGRRHRSVDVGHESSVARYAAGWCASLCVVIRMRAD